MRGRVARALGTVTPPAYWGAAHFPHDARESGDLLLGRILAKRALHEIRERAVVLHVSSAEALHGHCVTVCDGCEYRFGCDAFRDEFEAAVVISNDSDLFEPIPVVTQELAKPVELLVPEGVVISAKLKPIASFIRTIRRTALFRSQFADHLADANGAFQKPSRW